MFRAFQGRGWRVPSVLRLSEMILLRFVHAGHSLGVARAFERAKVVGHSVC